MVDFTHHPDPPAGDFVIDLPRIDFIIEALTRLHKDPSAAATRKGAALLNELGQMMLDNAPLIRDRLHEAERLRDYELLRPLAEWHEDDGIALWWRVPVCEPPEYVGSPLDDDWPFDDEDTDLYWTPIPGSPETIEERDARE